MVPIGRCRRSIVQKLAHLSSAFLRPQVAAPNAAVAASSTHPPHYSLQIRATETTKKPMARAASIRAALTIASLAGYPRLKDVVVAAAAAAQVWAGVRAGLACTRLSVASIESNLHRRPPLRALRATCIGDRLAERRSQPPHRRFATPAH